ncbi:MAG TPA: acetate--CoA ligase family protein, partial [Burkholderiales bacterium]|nr:acetate--CoA ligase family protein [Burkholderiales bacterium]
GEEGRELERQLLRTARENAVRVVGPNCLGLVNLHENVYAAFGSISRPPIIPRGRVSAVIQSGGFGNSIIMRCAAAGIGFRYIVASGNETDITAPELIDSYVDDPATDLILAYIEGIRDGQAFMRAARRALAAHKALVVWKAGNTRQGQRAAASHTANMTGSYDIYRAAFRQCGVVEIHDIDEAIDFIQCRLAQHRAPAGRNVVIMGGSGGSAVVFSDAADQYGLNLVRLSESTRRALAEALPRAASIDNPLDYPAGFLTDENTPRFIRAVDAVLADPEVHQLAVLFATVIGKQIVNGATALAAAQKRHDKPIYAFCSPPEEVTAGAYELLREAGIPNLGSPTRVARVMAMNVALAMAESAAAERHAGAPPARPEKREAHRYFGTLNEYDGKQLLARYGITVTHDVLLPAQPLGEAQLAPVRFPVALKIVSADIPHKTDIGGVELHIKDRKALDRAIDAMLARMRERAPHAKLEGLLVSEMVGEAIETIIGVVNDASFGPVVAFGLGGTFAELLKDMSYRIAPFDVSVAREMISELRAAHVFGGFRGGAAFDLEALANTLACVSELAWEERGDLVELDINPVLVRPAGQGVAAADALVVFDTSRESGTSTED